MINSKKFIQRFIVIIFLLLFSIWLVGGIIYNSTCSTIINERIAELSSVLNSIEPVHDYKINKIAVVTSKAIISRTVELSFYTEDNPKDVISKFKQYFISNGWEILEYSDDVKYLHLKAAKASYILTMDVGSRSKKNEPYNWGIFISFNDFFAKYNL